MNGEDKKLIEAFPVPISHISNFINDEERVRLCDRLKNAKYHQHSALSGNASSTHYYKKEINKDLGKQLLNRLEQSVNEYGKMFGLPPLKIFNTWANIQNSSSVLKYHTHPNAEVSGALYLNITEQGGKLNFSTPNPYISNQFYLERNWYNYESFWIQPKNCDLVLFPGWLKHGSFDNSMDNRVVVSFNAISHVFA